MIMPPPAAAPVQSPPRRTSRGLIAALVVLGMLVAAAAGMLVAREMSAPTDVALESVSTAGADPFMPSVGTDAVDVRPVANTTGRHSGTTPGLYGGSGSNTCDREQLSRFLGEHPDRAAGWASVLGLQDSSTSSISRYVDGLTSVVLRSDTYVTNHGWVGGHVTSWASVLQAGTAVLVDRYGNPVTRCFCGNPLSAPQSFSSVAYYGPRWYSFTSNSITVINHQTTTVTNNYTIVDVHTGRGWDRPVGSDGHHDTINVNITNNYFPPPVKTGDEKNGGGQGGPDSGPTNVSDPSSDTVTGGPTSDSAAGDGAGGAGSNGGEQPRVAVQPETGSEPQVDAQPQGSEGSSDDVVPARAPALAPAGLPEDTEAGGSDAAGTPVTSSTTTSTTRSAAAPSGTLTASGCFGDGSVTFAGTGTSGSYSAGEAGGTWTFSGTTLEMTPTSGDASVTTLTPSASGWTGSGCSLS
ncbi:hypothetical protein Acsp06_33800 [Actinomycetospora sp. NBRC 106375]|uniref:DUF6777 domain-containing protein n=1 Tax=Actinomycetospora sp. NBRC 106375 TaxID=3032207 RepID=UPI0024A5E777|nr:DUF6777 domain-containing protein [Actinomycetospora sp. NBRC 106375]GLZ47195.1 hypothetical protein Acsp06_33800 [Actinomycetospora sp. NBRC 106375]